MAMQTVRSVVAGAALVRAFALHLAGCTGNVRSIALGPDAVKGKTPDGTVDMQEVQPLRPAPRAAVAPQSARRIGPAHPAPGPRSLRAPQRAPRLQRAALYHLARRDHASFARFADPDGNGWVLEEVRAVEGGNGHPRAGGQGTTTRGHDR